MADPLAVDTAGNLLIWRKSAPVYLAQRTLLANLELAKRCTYTAIGEATAGGMIAGNLKHPQPKRRLRMTDLSQAEVTIDLRAGLAAVEDTGIDSYGWLLALYCTATRNATHELWLGPTQASVASTGTAAWYSDEQPFWKSLDNYRARFPRQHSWIELPTQRNDAWARYKITDPDNPDGFMDLGLLIPHPGYMPVHPVAERIGAGLGEEIREFRGVSGSRRREKRPRERVRSIVLQATGPDCVREVEEEWLAMQETVGVSEPLAAILNLDATARVMNQVIYGTVQGEPEMIGLPQPWNKAELSLTLQEML